jgi:hypothetical protein
MSRPLTARKVSLRFDRTRKKVLSSLRRVGPEKWAVKNHRVRRQDKEEYGAELRQVQCRSEFGLCFLRLD